ncbi:hypothetical protein LEP1GSC060_0228 [Leptospira weilii serovar Ranarum str. ICFT]|uniref:Uncharacterized protein n=1 Tax=Leptospira weilii serovar Ranarum str. ICFT TaxID=1218598 RepID=N1WKS2_9LEPT|nr:hypothetical protein LEP1GSC060_0228 [Leptospira weilii serovar Ranarum str. ICFT]
MRDGSKPQKRILYPFLIFLFLTFDCISEIKDSKITIVSDDLDSLSKVFGTITFRFENLKDRYSTITVSLMKRTNYEANYRKFEEEYSFCGLYIRFPDESKGNRSRLVLVRLDL